jgi:hypothetical protein
MRIRAWWWIASFASGFLLAMWASEINVHWRNEEIRVSAPRLHFISGGSLDSLKNGSAVPFDFQLQLWAGSRTVPLSRALERFVVSYDLWEEKYSVTRLRGSPGAPENQTASHLSANAAESWCVDNMALPASGLRGDQPFYVRLDVRAVEPRQGSGLISESGISLTRLIEVFSHPARPGQQKWTFEAGPLTLDDLKRSARGS